MSQLLTHVLLSSEPLSFMSPHVYERSPQFRFNTSGDIFNSHQRLNMLVRKLRLIPAPALFPSSAADLPTVTGPSPSGLFLPATMPPPSGLWPSRTWAFSVNGEADLKSRSL